MVWILAIPDGENFEDTVIRFDRIRGRDRQPDGQTDGQTSDDGMAVLT